LCAGVGSNRHHAVFPRVHTCHATPLGHLAAGACGLAGVPRRHALPQQWAARIGPGCPVNVSSITSTPHVGAHADAPLHYDPQGTPIGAVDLDAYLGPCRVIHAIGSGPLVTWDAHRACGRDLPPRVLVRTYERVPVDRWDAQLAAFAPETIERLADAGVRLVGIDTASIDPAESKTCPATR
jgi:arylformamidase